MMDENITSMVLYMMNLNSLSDPTADLRKVASHKPAGVAWIEFVAYEAITRRHISSNGRSVSARCSKFIHQRRAGILLKDRISWIWDYTSPRAGPKETNIGCARESGAPPRWSSPITVSFVSFPSPHSLHERSHWMLEHPIALEHKTDLDIITLIRQWYKR